VPETPSEGPFSQDFPQMFQEILDNLKGLMPPKKAESFDGFWKHPPFLVRFHLGAGKHFGHYQIKNRGGKRGFELIYYDPKNTRLFIKNGKLINKVNQTRKINRDYHERGERNKTPTAWVETNHRVKTRKETPHFTDLTRINFNPYNNIHWIIDEKNVDDEIIGNIETVGSALFITDSVSKSAEDEIDKNSGDFVFGIIYASYITKFVETGKQHLLFGQSLNESPIFDEIEMFVDKMAEVFTLPQLEVGYWKALEVQSENNSKGASPFFPAMFGEAMRVKRLNEGIDDSELGEYTAEDWEDIDWESHNPAHDPSPFDTIEWEQLPLPPVKIGILMRAFTKSGYSCLIVGGAVRDLMLGIGIINDTIYIICMMGKSFHQFSC